MADKILCPWCGAEMKIISNWAEWNEEFVAHTRCWNCQSNGPTARARNEIQAEKGAIEAALRRYTPPLKPMTLEKATGAEDPVWFESTGNVLCVCDCVFTPDMDGGAVEVYMMGRKGYSLLLSRQYGKTWRCWERKPTDEERSEAEWL